MRWLLVRILILDCSVIVFNAYGQQTTSCLATGFYEAPLIPNPDAKVTFKCDQATPLDLIRSIGRQTRVAIGIVPGQNPDILTKEKRAFDLNAVSIETALTEAVRNTEYTQELDAGVWVILAGDRTLRQNQILTQRYPDFKTTAGTMVEIGAGLTMMMLFAADPSKGFAESIGGALNDEKFALKIPRSATTKEIANLIVSQGSKGMWILSVSPDASNADSDHIEIEPYQHYSNRPVEVKSADSSAANPVH